MVRCPKCGNANIRFTLEYRDIIFHRCANKKCLHKFKRKRNLIITPKMKETVLRFVKEESKSDYYNKDLIPTHLLI